MWGPVPQPLPKVKPFKNVLYYLNFKTAGSLRDFVNENSLIEKIIKIDYIESKELYELWYWKKVELNADVLIEELEK